MAEKTRTNRFRSNIGLAKVAQHNFGEFTRTTITFGLAEDHPSEDNPTRDSSFEALFLAFLRYGIECGGGALLLQRAGSRGCARGGGGGVRAAGRRSRLTSSSENAEYVAGEGGWVVSRG